MIHRRQKIRLGSHWPVMEILTAFVREHPPRLTKREELRLEDLKAKEAMIAHRRRSQLVVPVGDDLTALDKRILDELKLKEANLWVSADVQATLTVLGRRNAIADRTVLNLSEANLRGADLSGADLRRADLSRANLELTNLRAAHLEGANLVEADLREADLKHAFLLGADVRHAKHLTWDQLREAEGFKLADSPASVMRTSKEPAIDPPEDD